MVLPDGCPRCVGNHKQEIAGQKVKVPAIPWGWGGGGSGYK